MGKYNLEKLRVKLAEAKASRARYTANFSIATTLASEAMIKAVNSDIAYYSTLIKELEKPPQVKGKKQ